MLYSLHCGPAYKAGVPLGQSLSPGSSTVVWPGVCLELSVPLVFGQVVNRVCYSPVWLFCASALIIYMFQIT